MSPVLAPPGLWAQRATHSELRWDSHATYLFTLRAGGALRAGEAAVPLFALLPRGADESDQAGVTLWETKE